MLTVTQRSADGTERTFQILEACVRPGGRAELELRTPEGVETHQDGTFYVMNDAGSTVATYRLDPPAKRSRP